LKEKKYLRHERKIFYHIKRPADKGLAEMESKLTTFEYKGRKGGGPSLEDVEITRGLSGPLHFSESNLVY